MLNQNQKYNKTNLGQADKRSSLLISKELVKEVKELFEPYLLSCEMYEPEDNLRINKAPAVKVNGKLVIAPDIRCITKSGQVFWIEVKDKAQRFFYPDTGADLHQVLGWYDINKFLNEPVLVIFKDPDLNSCIPNDVSEYMRIKFEKRWNTFKGHLYGGWLFDLLEYDDRVQYPCVFNEKSRNMYMPILYFHINKMVLIDNPDKIINNINYRILTNLKTFKMEYSNRKRIRIELDECALRSLAYSGSNYK